MFSPPVDLFMAELNVQNKLEIPFRTSKDKEDSKKAAEELDERTDISPYSVPELTNLIRAGARNGEINLEPSGRSSKIVGLLDWFENRVKTNTISLEREDYLRALSSSFELLTIGDPAKTDFGSSRQREFGQQWTDFTRGYLGEIAMKKFFEKNLETKVELDQREAGDVDSFLPTDLSKIESNDEMRPVDFRLSIKTSKLGSMWLGIPNGQLGHSDAFSLVKIGIPLNHLAIFLKEIDGLEELLQFEEGEDKQEILNAIPDFKPIPAYIPGFAYRKDFEEGELEMSEARKYVKVSGGIGRQPDEAPDGFSGIKIKGIGSMNEEYISSTGAMKFARKDWAELAGKMKPDN